MQSTRDFAIATTAIGFNRVRYGINAAGKPFMEFFMPDTAENRDYLSQGGFGYDAYHKNGGQAIAASGVISSQDDSIKVTVVGKSPVAFALGIFKEEINYKRIAAGDKAEFDLFIAEIVKRILERTMPAARYSKRDFKFNTVKFFTGNVRIVKTCKPGKSSSYHYKNNNTRGACNPKVNELESASAALFKLLNGHDAVPKTQTYYDTPTKRACGLLSSTIKSYIDSQDYLNPRIFESNVTALCGQLIVGGMVPMLIASYVFEETDLHGANWGVDANLKIMRIDFAKSLWPLSSKYHSISPREIMLFSNPGFKHLEVRPVDAFPITVNDIMNFPLLSDAKPLCWPFGIRYNSTRINLSQMNKIPEFQNQKWKYFIKALLMTDEVVTAIFDGYFSSPKTKAKFTAHMLERLRTLRDVLISIPEFCQFVLNNTNVIHELLKEFKRYNDVIKPKAADLKIDLQKVKEIFDLLVSLASLREREVKRL